MSERPSKATILSALSRALDRVEGQPDGHAIRTSALAQRIAIHLGFSNEARADVHYAALLKDSGCSNNSIRIQNMFGGDELFNKREVKFIDWTSPLESVKFALTHTEPGQSVSTKLRRMLANVGPPGEIMRQVTEARCTRGALIASKLGLSQATADGIHSLDEHWDGHGAPMRLSGDSIPILARILCLCQTFEVFYSAFDLATTCDMVSARRGRWFDPEIADICLSIAREPDFAARWHAADLEKDIQQSLPGIFEQAVEADIDAICEAFAMIIDAKSSFTSEHSTRVTEYALRLARWLGFDPERLSTLRRASLLHDLGKLGISNSILEKPDRLTEEEFAKIRMHPQWSQEILAGIPGFTRISQIAGAHHERLDGRGYWQGLTAEQLDLDMRVLTAADVFDALTAKRPYRDAMPTEQALAIMSKDSGTAFDPLCLEGLGANEFAPSSLAA